MGPLLQRFSGLLKDPSPDFVFEFTGSGIAFARPSTGSPPAFVPFEPGVIVPSPLVDNIQKPDTMADLVRGIVGTGSGRRGGSAVVILPDYSSRIAVLGFDQFPSDPAEQLSLVRFRMKKSVPFDVDSAVVSFHVQTSGKGKADVVVAAAALEIVARYEASVRAAGLQAGLVTTAAVAMFNLLSTAGISVLARLTGSFLSILVANGSTLKLVRTVELTDVSSDEILGVLFPTLAYVEDELGAPADRIHVCGFEENGRIPEWVSDLQLPVEPLRSRFGTPNGANAGLLGYLESVSPGAKAA